VDGRSIARALAGAVALLLLPAAVLAETPPGTYGGDTGATGTNTGPVAPLLWIVTAIVVVAAVLLVARRVAPRAVRPLAAVLTVAATAVVVVLILLIGVLSSWTDAGTNIPLPFVVTGAIVAIGGLALAVGLLRRGAGSRDPVPVATPEPDPSASD
jgi:hypothetical protein